LRVLKQRICVTRSYWSAFWKKSK